MKNTFVLLLTPGTAWVEGKTVREQPYWTQHADFMDQLFANGIVVLGGPFTDTSGSMVVVEAESKQVVVDLFARDPFMVHNIFALNMLKQWQLFLDARSMA